MHTCLRLAHACVVSSVVLVLWMGSTHSLRAQTSSSSTSSSTNTAPKAPGFAIESEMMTYSAMDAEGQAVACGIARNLGAVDERCTPKGVSGPAGGVIVVTAPSSALAEFQVWRTDLSTMMMLTARAEHYCPKNGQRGALSTILSMIPEGQAVTFAQALLTTTSESSPVQGNILDNTLVNDVAGHLRALGVLVILPDTYMPHSLATIDQRHSPFLVKFGDLLKARTCLDPAPKDDSQGGPDGGQTKSTQDERQVIALAIDDFVKSLSESAIVTGPKTSDSTTPAQPQLTISHLNAVLRADGLAQELGVSSDLGSGEGGGWYLLSLKALESGGTELKSGNVIRGTKTSYSGGSVGTYALFRLTGSVVCSGVFYNYAGALESSKIPKMLEGGQIIPSGKLVGGCAASQ